MGYIANALYIIGNESGALEYFYERKRSCEVLESCVPPIKLLAEFKLAGNTRKAISSNVQSDY